MAKNYLDQILNLVGLKLPDSSGHYDPSVYRDEFRRETDTSEVSGVEKYLQKQKANTAQATTELTSVEKYLAKKQAVEQQASKPEATDQTSITAATELTSVAKYLAKIQQQEQKKAEAEAAMLASMTGVARYLAKFETKNKTTSSKTAPAKIVNPANLTGVAKYLAQQKSTAPVEHQTEALEETFKEPKFTATEEKPAAEEKQEIQAIPAAKKTQEPAVSAQKEPAIKAKIVNPLIDLADNATQCQAATVKGTQCRRKTNLEVIEKTVNKQKYKFSVCSQHNNNDFMPFSELLQNT